MSSNVSADANCFNSFILLTSISCNSFSSLSAISNIPSGYSIVPLQTDEQITVDQLLRVLMVHSANDAANVLAFHIDGSISAFAERMNAKLNALGLHDSHFTNPSGQHDENHYSTASDMVKIAMELVNNYPDVYKFSSVYESYVRENTPNKTWIANTNKLVRFYEGADGLKTGSTNDAGKCIVATAKRNGLRLIAISLGYKDVTTRNKETMDLLDYGFNQYEINMLYEKDKKVGTVNVDKVNEKIDLYAKEDIFILKKKICKRYALSNCVEPTMLSIN